MSTTNKASYGTSVAMTVTNLNSLANNQTAGWQSDRISNLVLLALDFLISIKLTMANTAPANDKVAYVYAVPWYTSDGGTTWFTSDGGTATLPSGTEGTYTIANPNNLLFLGALNYTTQQQVIEGVFALSNAFGQFMPQAWSLVVIDYTGAAISGSGNVVQYTPVSETNG